MLHQRVLFCKLRWEVDAVHKHTCCTWSTAGTSCTIRSDPAKMPSRLRVALPTDCCCCCCCTSELPPGYTLSMPQGAPQVQVVACLPGTYQPDYLPYGTTATDTKCSECPQGVTTRFNAATSSAACNSKLLAWIPVIDERLMSHQLAHQMHCELNVARRSPATICSFCSCCCLCSLCSRSVGTAEQQHSCCAAVVQAGSLCLVGCSG